MRALIVTPWDQEWGGVASVAGCLARYFQGRGHDALFFHPGNSERLRRGTTKMGYEGTSLALRGWSSTAPSVRTTLAFGLTIPGVLAQLAWLLRRERIDVVNIHYPVPQFAPFAMLRRLGLGRLVLSIHGSDFFPGGERVTRVAPETRLTLAAADAVVAPSWAMMARFADHFPEYADRCTWIHNGIDPDALEPPANAAPGVEPPYFLCVAAQNASKGVDVLLKGYGELRATRPEAPPLVLVGDGPDRPHLESLARELGIADRTLFLGARPNEEACALMTRAEALVLPSRAESFGLVLLEAMLAGAPVVASRAGGIPEILEGAAGAVLVPPEDPPALARGLGEVLDSPEIKARARSDGPTIVRSRFHFEESGRHYEALFRSLVEGRGVPSRPRPLPAPVP